MPRAKHKILTIVGARPNFIKAAPLSKALAEEGCFEEIIVHTGQHYDYLLSESFFKELGMAAPAYNLGTGSGRQAWQLGNMIAGIDSVIEKESPGAIVVFGDTNSTAAGAIAGAKNNVPVAHVEAGLREFDKRIPEEVNKLLTTACTDLYFCPTQTGVANLAKTGIAEHVHLVGDIGIDLVSSNLKKIEAGSREVLRQFGVASKSYFFVTCHRAANTSNPKNLAQILAALSELPLLVIFPIHPRTQRAIDGFGFPQPSGAVQPLGFFETQVLIRHAKAVITDSGGVTKEAYFHKTPGVIIDRQTEWVETVEEGWNKIAGPNRRKILEYSQRKQLPKIHSNCLGDGTASKKIAAILKTFLETHARR